jgi:hypothetical protein
MAGRPTDDDVNLAPSAEPVRAAYERDFYSWLMEQARLVRAGQWSAVDRENLAEEIEAWGREQFNTLARALRVLLLHLLKWDFQAEKRTRSSALSIAAQRLEIEDILADNPGLKPRIPEAMARAYRKARIDAAKETGLEETHFPEKCEYTFEDTMTRRVGA